MLISNLHTSSGTVGHHSWTCYVVPVLMCNTAAHAPEDVLPAFEESLKSLGLDYVDLYLMHYPCAMDPKVDGIKVLDIPYTATWAAMEGQVAFFHSAIFKLRLFVVVALTKTGKCRNIGISSEDPSHLSGSQPSNVLTTLRLQQRRDRESTCQLQSPPCSSSDRKTPLSASA